ncbi:MAG TPA: hypothetical protein PKE69_01265 [Pyrinomonadaceae bacterium]|nr:hypothetical protein [Pyrinomonadaceae bacterium]
MSIVVSGDITLDCQIARTPAVVGDADWNLNNYAQAYLQRGGALLLGDVIEKLAEKLLEQEEISVELRKIKEFSLDLCDTGFHRSFALWSLFDYDQKPFTKRKVWRVQEFLGLHRSMAADYKILDDTNEDKANIVIFDDANLGFRESEKLWNKSKINEKTWILLKMASPIGEGKLWKELYKNHAERRIVSLTVDDLRLTNVQVSRELSWEQTAQDLLRELMNTPSINSLFHCAHVIVSFGTSGAVLLSHRQPTTEDPRQFVARLIFDPNIIEGMWRQNHPGRMIGYNTCMIASLALTLMRSFQEPDKEPNLKQGVIEGLAAMRRLHLEGYEKNDTNPKEPKLTFPTDTIIKELLGESESDLRKEFSVVDIHEPVQQAVFRQKVSSTFWTILEDRCREGLNVTARDIVLFGAKRSLEGVPLGQFGKLLTVDRHEIESLRSIRTLVNEYVNKENSKKPISIAVFGAPGSGKSFGIAQMANTLLPGRIEKRTFNLSQFDTAQDLWDALHQVRDVSLSEKIPLIFWDEFDTTFEDNPLGWLRYFLAPMQDGEFQDGQIMHPIGRAIFVFAGGTAERMIDFGGNLSPKEFKSVKGPDFVSRLKGFVNILGPNAHKTDKDPDPYFIIRRAIILRSLFERETPHLFDKETKTFQIDEGVLRAILETPEYKHGVRSMESVIAMSMLKGKQKFERSSLPSEAQLDLHVDSKRFMELVNRVNLTGDILEILAREIHALYEEKFAIKASEQRLFDEIPSDEKEQNKGLANDIPNKLGKIGCVMTPLRGKKKIFRFKNKEIEFLAEMEHERWMRGKLKEGWRYAPKKEKLKKLHDGILHWREHSETELAQLYSPEELNAIDSNKLLSDYYKDIDRHMIKNIPRILEKAGETIVRQTLVIGVTGHRILTDLKKIKDGVEKALQHIEETFQYQTLAVMSSLAIGADTIVAQKILNHPGAKLIVPLPLEEVDYETDFEPDDKMLFQNLLRNANEVIELPDADSREEAYEACGKFILENCDVLLTIWDGKSAQGKGGTGEIVSLARERDLPIAWIHAGNRKPGTQDPTSLGDKQGKVIFENF